ncbi:hypothetical protein Taro_018664 [Colocasia esculenta]|uniref:Uncharacterized protein n=1 Tax=Colocasia esculenta TaxID=4460 RepID=A0A843UUI1_COLES|nr:hypothetical protein [Colocasia esculenta]
MVRASCPIRWSGTHVASMKWRALSWPEISRDVRKSQKLAGTSRKARNRSGRPLKPEIDRDVRQS